MKTQNSIVRRGGKKLYEPLTREAIKAGEKTRNLQNLISPPDGLPTLRKAQVSMATVEPTHSGVLLAGFTI